MRICSLCIHEDRPGTVLQPQPPQSTPPSTTAFSLSEVALRICLAGVLLALAMSADTSCPKQQVELDPRENSRRKVPSHNAKGERLQPQEIPAVQVYLALARVLLCLDTGITHQSWPTGTQEMPKNYPADPKSKGLQARLTTSEPDLCLLAGTQPALHHDMAVAVESIPAPGQRGFKAALCL